VRNVEAKIVRQTNCGMVAFATVDFEPLSSGGYEFELAHGLRVVGRGFAGVPLEFVTALDHGIRGELADDEHNIEVAARVLLRQVKLHAVDSSPRAFQAVGRKAVLMALARPPEGG
jgi:hypothetical protein